MLPQLPGFRWSCEFCRQFMFYICKGFSIATTGSMIPNNESNTIIGRELRADIFGGDPVREDTSKYA